MGRAGGGGVGIRDHPSPINLAGKKRSRGHDQVKEDGELLEDRSMQSFFILQRSRIASEELTQD